jgi:hypothetical protein
MAVDLKALPRNDQILLGAAALAFIFTFLPFDGIHSHGVGANESAWHGAPGVLACLCVVLALVIALAQTFAAENLPKLAVSWNMVLTGLGALAVILYVIRWLTLPSNSVFGVSYSVTLQWGGYVEIVLCVVFTAFAFMRVRESGEAMPWENRGTAPTAPPAPTPPAA